MPFRDVIGFGVAGNFAGHLEQAGEAADFVAVEVKEATAPKAIFPFYVPSEAADFLSTYPLSFDTIVPPNDADNLQIEPEVALLCDIQYEDGRVTTLTPVKFAAYNDCSIRRPHAKKISEKKNWGAETKGVSSVMMDVDHLEEGGVLDRFRIASFHKRDEKVERYGEDSPVVGYSYFHQKLLNWIIDRMNHQKDAGPAEDISEHLASAGYPEQALISIGATRYTEYGETNFLKSGDTSMVVVYDGERYTPEQIAAMAEKGRFAEEGISSLIQKVA
ncbi:MAG: DUF5718 family protein [Endozoicomonas sp.]